MPRFKLFNKALKVYKGTDGSVEVYKINRKPRYYLIVVCYNGKVAVNKFISKDGKDINKLDNKYKKKFRLDLNEILSDESNFKSKKFLNSTLDFKTYTKIGDSYLDINDFKDTGIYFDKKDSQLILKFILSDDNNRQALIDFLVDNGSDSDELTFYIKNTLKM